MDRCDASLSLSRERDPLSVIVMTSWITECVEFRGESLVRTERDRNAELMR